MILYLMLICSLKSIHQNQKDFFYFGYNLLFLLQYFRFLLVVFFLGEGLVVEELLEDFQSFEF